MKFYAMLALLLLTSCTNAIGGFGSGSFYAKGDDAAIHDNVAGEISAVGSITPAGADYVLLEDASAGDVKGKATLTAIFAALGSSGSAPTVDSTLAQCQALTPVEGDLCFPTDSPYTLVARSAGVWSYRYPGIGFDVSPPPSAGWSWYNQGTATITTAGGMERLTLPAEVFAGNGFRGRMRPRPSDPSITPYYVDFCLASAWIGGGASGQGAHSAAHTDGTGLHVLYAGGGYIAQQIFSAPATFVSGPSAEAVAPSLFCGRLTEDGTNRAHYVTSPTDGTRTAFGAASSRTGTFTADKVGFFGNMADADSARQTYLVHWSTGSL